MKKLLLIMFQESKHSHALDRCVLYKYNDNNNCQELEGGTKQGDTNYDLLCNNTTLYLPLSHSIQV